MNRLKKFGYAFAILAAGLGFWVFEAKKSAWNEGREIASAKESSPAINADRSSKTPDSAGPRRAPSQDEPAPIARNVAATSPLKDWSKTHDPISGKIRTYSGGKIALPGKDDIEKANGFVRSYALDLFGVSASDLAFAKSSKAARMKITYQQMMSGFPVFGSTLSLLFEAGELQRVQNDLVGEASLPARPEGKFEEIFELYRQSPGGGLRGRHEPIQKVELASEPSLTPRLMLLPVNQGLIFVYQFYVDETHAGGHSRRAMVLYDPANSRVVKKTDMHID